MTLARSLIYGFPLLVVALAWWSARVSAQSHGHVQDGVVVMLSQQAPVLNPFLPATEAERQMVELLHASLLKIDDAGRLKPGLADLWRWSQDVTCWFADAATAKRAEELLQAQIGEANRWAEWHLLFAQARENTLRLSFGETATTGVGAALETLQNLQPLPVSFWRVECARPLKAAVERFQKAGVGTTQVRRVWFDGSQACELVISGAAQRVVEDLRRALDASSLGTSTFTLLGDAGALVEPVLDLDMRPGCTWHDGTVVLAEDARATLDFLRGHDWQMPGHEVLGNVQALEVQKDGARLHVVLRRRYGPALAALAEFPILPSAWLKLHGEAVEQDFLESPPPGAGTHRLVARDARHLVLEPVEAAAGARRVLFNFAASPVMNEIGMRTRTVDFIWPAAVADRVARQQLRTTPARQRLVILWNTRHPMLKEAQMREALGLVVDVPALLGKLPGGLSAADASVFAPGLWFSTGAKRPACDLAKARQLLFEQGWPQDVEGVARSATQALEFSLLVPAGDALHEQVAELLQQEWRKVGARVRIERAEDSAALVSRLQEHRFDAVLLDQRFEASWDLSPWWHSAQAKLGGTNFCGIAAPQIDLLLQALATEFDPEKIPGRVKELESRLLPLHPMLTLFATHDDVALVSSRSALSPAGAPTESWTLQDVALPARKAEVRPVIDLQMRMPE